MFKIKKISIFKKNPNFSKVNKRSKRTNVISGSIQHFGSSSSSGVGGYSHKEILKDIDIKDINSYVTLYDKNLMTKLQNFGIFTLKQILRKEKLNNLKNNKDKQIKKNQLK